MKPVIKIENTIEGRAGGILFGSSVSLSLDGMIVAIGAYENVRVFSYTLSTNSQDILGSPIVGVAWDFFGKSISLLSDEIIVTIGAACNNNNGSNSGYARVFFYTSSTNTWDILGSLMLGTVVYDWFGSSISLLLDGMVVTIRAYRNDNNGKDSGHTCIFPAKI